MSVISPDPMPFIIGASRSGTTLLRLMLDAHPQMAIPPETHFLPRCSAIDSRQPGSREALYDVLVNCQTWNDFEIDSSEFQRQLTQLEPFSVGDGLRCFYKSYANRFNKSRWGDKTPIYLKSIKSIYALLPEAHFIHVIRDGRDVALSKRLLWFGPGGDVGAQAHDWVEKISEARLGAYGIRNYLEIHYEELVTESVVTLERVCRFLKLPYSPEMLEYHRKASERLNEIKDWYREDGTLWVPRNRQLSIHQLTSFPPTRERIEKWRREMSKDEIDTFEEIAHDMLIELGYELSNQSNSRC